MPKLFYSLAYVMAAVLILATSCFANTPSQLPYNEQDIARAEEIIKETSGHDINFALEKARNNKGVYAALLLIYIEPDSRVDMMTPLHLAAQAGRADLVECLIAKGADVNAWGDGGATPLHVAALAGSVGCVSALLENKADVNAKTDNGETPLFFAVGRKGNLEIVKILLAKGADPNAKNKNSYPVLNYARDNAKLASALIAAGADVNVKNEFGETLLDLVSRAGNRELAELLIYKGAKPTLINAIHMRDVNAVKDMIAKGVDINAVGKYGNTALCEAIDRGNLDMVKLLVTSGAKITTSSKSRINILESAIAGDHTEIAKYLISKGASVKGAPNSTITPLHLVRDKSLAQLLIARGANVNAGIKTGQTPLDYAISRRQNDIVAVLKSHGAKRGIKKSTRTDPKEIDEYKRIQSLRSETSKINKEIWRLLEQQKQDKTKAIKALEEMLVKYEKHPALSLIQCALGRAYEPEDPQKAESYYLQAMNAPDIDGQPAPGHMGAVECLAGLREKQGRYQEAVELLKQWRAQGWCGNGNASSNFQNTVRIWDLMLNFSSKEQVIADIWKDLLSVKTHLSLGFGESENGWAFEIRRICGEDETLLISSTDAADKRLRSTKPASQEERYHAVELDRVIREIRNQISLEKTVASESTVQLIGRLGNIMQESPGGAGLDAIFGGGRYSRYCWPVELIMRKLRKTGDTATADLIKAAKTDESNEIFNPLIAYAIGTLGGDSAVIHLIRTQSKAVRDEDIQSLYYCLMLTKDPRAIRLVSDAAASKDAKRLPDAADYALKAYKPSEEVLNMRFSPRKAMPRPEMAAPYY